MALWQAEYTKRLLAALGVDSELEVIKTKGDRIQDIGFNKMEGKGFFTKEIEDALLEERVDLAVHSMKDLPTTQPEGLVLAGVSEREDPADVLVMSAAANGNGVLGLPTNPRIGTSSARRKALLRHLLGAVNLVDIRGNVPTRMGKIESEGLDGVILAQAGLNRLGVQPGEYRMKRLDPREFVPAPAQGVLAWQVREADKELRKVVLNLHHKSVASCTNIERKVLQLMEGGCQMPLGVYCHRDKDGHYHLWAAMADHWEGPVRTAQHSSSTSFGLAEKMVESLKKAVV